MVWHEGDDVEQYLAAVGDLLLAEPGVHTISLSVCENVRARPDGTRFAWWQEPDGEVTGCASRTPPYPIVAEVLPEHAIVPLVDLWEVDAVNAPTPLAAQVAATAARRYGRTARLKTAERLFRLGELIPPEAPGKPRVADEGDAELLVRWFDDFVAEAGLLPQDARKAVRDRLSYDGFVVWEDDGEPVALAGHTRKSFQGMRIGPVWTPPEHRGNGYGGAATAAASQKCLDEGAWEVVLFTDLTNPTSNALYPRLGYRPVMDRAVFLIG
jgi:RimJ/RimL family protein N-acetyltransferase